MTVSALVPCRIWPGDDRVRLLDVSGVDLVEPFFGDTIRRLVVEQGRQPVDESLSAWDPEGPELAGSIFHVGRCGSTLLSSMVQAASERCVIREPPAGNDLTSALVAPSAYAVDPSEGWRRLVASFGAATGGPTVVKHSSWEALFAADLVRAMRAPVVAMVREPTEVVSSLVDQPPSWVRDLWLPPDRLAIHYPGVLEAAGSPPRTAVDWYLALWMATADTLLSLDAESVLVVNYDDLIRDPVEVLTRVLALLGLKVPHRRSIAERIEPFRSAYSKASPRDPSVPYDPMGSHARPSLRRQTVQRIRERTDARWRELLQRSNQDRR